MSNNDWRSFILNILHTMYTTTSLSLFALTLQQIYCFSTSELPNLQVTEDSDFQDMLATLSLISDSSIHDAPYLYTIKPIMADVVTSESFKALLTKLFGDITPFNKMINSYMQWLW